jgi:class 3 adenylate cyclase
VGDSFIAYQVLGDGPIDVVYDAGWIGHLEAQWDYPALARFLTRLASFSRLICLDHRGHGLSDPVDVDDMTLEQWMEDVHVVMDAAGSERAALVGAPEGGPMAILHAATYPERTSALVLINTAATMIRSDDYPWGLPPDAAEKHVNEWQKAYWDDQSTELMIGSLTSDEDDRERVGRMARYAMSPGRSKRFARVVMDTDVRDVLSAVRVPTLVLHRAANRYRRVGHGRYLAQAIPDARYVELPGHEHWPQSGDQDALLDEIEEFLTGVRPIIEADRVLATVLFTDIAVSTERVAALGDKRWRELLDRHDAIVDSELARHRGRKVNPTGDGFLATFDGPARAIRCAVAIRDSVRPIGLDVRAGIHTGEIELRDEDVAGIAVHIGQRVQAVAQPNEVLVSRTVTDLVAGSGLSFTSRGDHVLRGVPGTWQLYAVTG